MATGEVGVEAAVGMGGGGCLLLAVVRFGWWVKGELAHIARCQETQRSRRDIEAALQAVGGRVRRWVR